VHVIFRDAHQPAFVAIQIVHTVMISTAQREHLGVKVENEERRLSRVVRRMERP
jgi:hypothetical protein